MRPPGAYAMPLSVVAESSRPVVDDSGIEKMEGEVEANVEREEEGGE